MEATVKNSSSETSSVNIPAFDEIRQTLPIKIKCDRPKLQAGLPHVLSSCDTISTPDLEKLLLNSTLMQSSQPIYDLFDRKSDPVTSEQEAFGKGFDEALRNLQNNQQNSQINMTTNDDQNCNDINKKNISSSKAVIYANNITTNSDDIAQIPVSVIYEEHNYPMELQKVENIRLEHKRELNRLAATKCRLRKLERIAKLQDRVKFLNDENNRLGQEVDQRKHKVAILQQEVVRHMNLGCDILSIQCNNFISH